MHVGRPFEFRRQTGQKLHMSWLVSPQPLFGEQPVWDYLSTRFYPNLSSASGWNHWPAGHTFGQFPLSRLFAATHLFHVLRHRSSCSTASFYGTRFFLAPGDVFGQVAQLEDLPLGSAGGPGSRPRGSRLPALHQAGGRRGSKERWVCPDMNNGQLSCSKPTFGPFDFPILVHI